MPHAAQRVDRPTKESALEVEALPFVPAGETGLSRSVSTLTKASENAKQGRNELNSVNVVRWTYHVLHLFVLLKPTFDLTMPNLPENFKTEKVS